jgi:hypothetical protein
MRNLFTLIILILTVTFAFGQTEKTLVRTFNLQGSTKVILNLEGATKVENWSENTLRVHTNIVVSNTNVLMLKELITTGRYNLVLESTDTAAVLSAPARAQAVVINKLGETLKETVSYTVFVPNNVTVEFVKSEALNETASTGDK